jgi:hypothetical protein
MNISCAGLKLDRQWRAAIGMNEERFFQLLNAFKTRYSSYYGDELKSQLVGDHSVYCIKNEEDLLLFTLFSLKSGLTYDVLGFVCGMNGSNAKRNQTVGLDILQLTLDDLDHMPRRSFTDVADFERFFSKEKELIIDATEQRKQRPIEKEKQKEYYSGKKKDHTLKSMIISNSKKRIGYISQSFIGKKHDYAILKEIFLPSKHWFRHFSVLVDLGYLGIKKDYLCNQIEIPHKKTKTKPLTLVQKSENKIFSAKRIFVEQSIGGIKRYRILSDRLRIHHIDLYDKILGVCTGLWNFYIFK